MPSPASFACIPQAPARGGTARSSGETAPRHDGRDAQELMAKASEIPIQVAAQRFGWNEVHEALGLLKVGRIDGAAVLEGLGPPIDSMTIYDYNIVMISVNIATLKAKLSFYLNQVRRGQEVLVLDRRTPVARVVSSRGSQDDVVLAEASKSPAALQGIRVRPLRRRTDSARALRDDRDRR